MGLTDNTNMTMPVAPMYGGNNMGFGGQDGWWLILLFLFAFNGGWGGGFGGGSTPYVVNNDVQRGFDQSAIMGGLNGLTTAVTNGFANAEISRANTNTATLQALWNMQSAQQQCCCDTRSAIADVKYAIATENCADRQVVSDGIRDIISSNQEQTTAILSKLAQLELDAKNDKIADLERQFAPCRCFGMEAAFKGRLRQYHLRLSGPSFTPSAQRLGLSDDARFDERGLSWQVQ